MATILTKKSDTSSSVPLAADLTNAAGGAELAVNTADKRLYSKTSGGSVVELGTNPSALSLPNGTANGVPYLNGSKVLTSGSALTFDGTNLTTTGSVYIANAQYLYGKTSGAVSTRMLGINGANDLYFGSVDAAVGNIIFTNNGEQMRLTSTGLGIGTSSITAIYGKTLQIGSGGSENTVSLVGPTGSVFLATVGATGQLIARGGTSLQLGANDSVHATLSTSGNLGLGVTPSAWGSSWRSLDVGGGGAFAGAFNSAYMLGNAYYSASGGVYKSAGAAGHYGIEAGTHVWKIAPSGTAGNAISFTQAMTLDAGGYLLVGATSTSGAGTSRFQVGDTNSASQMLVKSNTAHAGIYASSSADTYFSWNTSGFLAFGQGPTNGATFTERARIDSSGNLLVGTTSVLPSNLLSGKFQVLQTSSSGHGASFKTNAASGFAAAAFSRDGNNGAACEFLHSPANTVGSISVTSSATAYNTSSDYRLKEDIQTMTGALAKIQALKPVTYTWKADGSSGEGFIAHELAEVCPAAVTGEKDAVDAEGNPQYQGIDVSFLVGTLTAAIQEQQAIIEGMKTRLAALESK